MNNVELMKMRHSVRSYKEVPIADETAARINETAAQLSAESGLDIFLVTDNAAAFDGFLGKYGKFSNAKNYIVIAGKKSPDLEEKAGYYGEKLVLELTEMGLGTCWVAATYSKKSIAVPDNETIVCIIAAGYAAVPGSARKSKTAEQAAEGGIEGKPGWFARGVEAALLAPTAMNQQKFIFAIDGNIVDARISSPGFYTKLDLGIVKCHFELGAGKENFTWKK